MPDGGSTSAYFSFITIPFARMLSGSGLSGLPWGSNGNCWNTIGSSTLFDFLKLSARRWSVLSAPAASASSASSFSASGSCEPLNFEAA